MVYVSQGRLFTRRLDQPNATELAGTQGAYAPFFSPDGQWVAFFSPGKLQKISVEGGSAITLCDAGNRARRQLGRGWQHHRGAQHLMAALSRIPSAGGPPTPVTELQNGEVTPPLAANPAGRQGRVVHRLARGGGFDGANIEVMSLADHRRKTLVARRHVRALFAQRPACLHEPRHAVCCTVRRGSAGSSRDACPGARPNRLQRRIRVRHNSISPKPER